jgi:hypothetical protein
MTLVLIFQCELNKIKALKEKPDNHDPLKLEELENKLKLDTKDIKKLSTEEWAKKAGLHDIYLTAYTILSGTVHVKISDLEQYTDANDNGDIISFKHGPNDTGLDIVLSSAIEFVQLTTRFTLGFFKIDKKAELDALHMKLTKAQH